MRHSAILILLASLMQFTVGDVVVAQWVQTGLDSGYVLCFAASGGRVFAGTGFSPPSGETGGSVFVSSDGGASWSLANSGLPYDSTTRQFDNVTSLIDNGTILFAGTSVCSPYGGGGRGVFCSTNYGSNWAAANAGLPFSYVEALAVSGSNIFAGTWDGVFRSTNNGTSWTAANTGLTNIEVRCLAVKDAALFAGTFGGGVFLSTNNGTSWTAINNGLTDTTVSALAVSGTNLFAGTYDGGVFLSTDNGSNWTAANSGLTESRVRALAVSGTNLFAGTYLGVFLSTDNGANWSSVNSGLTDTHREPDTFISALAAIGGNLFAGTAGGGVWRRPLSEMLTSIAVSGNVCVHPNPASHQFEPSIAVHPSDSKKILISASARSDEKTRIGWYYSTDGGVTWAGKDTLPTQTDFVNKHMTNSTAAIDLDGNLFVSGFIANNSGTAGNFVLSRSTDAGENWSQTALPTSVWPERPHMTIDLSAESPNKNRVYVTYTEIRDPQPGPVFFSRSSDQGQSLSTPMIISGTISSGAALGANLAVAADGTLYATWSGFDTRPFDNPTPFHLGFNISTDGGASWVGAKSLRMINFNGSAHGVDFFNCPSMAVDKSSSGRRGWIYIAYAERNPSAPDIFLIRSSDQGASWSDPVKVNQDSDNSRDQWQPWISVDPSTGSLFVVYLDARNFPQDDPAKDSVQVYISASFDGGQTFKDTLVSDVPFHPTPVQNAWPVAPNLMGSYIGICALRDTTWTTWNDNRSGLMLGNRRLHQVYASRMIFPPPGLPAQVALVSPDTKLDTHYGQFHWQSSTPNVTSYGFECAMDSTFSPKIVDSIVTETSLVLTGLETGHIYWWRVRAKNVLGWGPYSAARSFLTVGIAETKQVPTAFGLEQNYPNPFNPSTTIRYSLPHRSPVTLIVFNTLGQEVATLFKGEKEAGYHEVKFEGAGLSSGVYFYRMTAGNYVATKKFLLLR